MPVTGYIGGFFENLGLTGIMTVIIGGVIFVFLHGYVSGVITQKIAKDPNNPTEEEFQTAEIYTSAALASVPAIFGVIRTSKYPYESDVLDTVGCLMGGGLLWEVFNAIEILSSRLGLWT